MKYKLLSLLTILFISCQQRYSADDFDLVINNVKLFDGHSIFKNVTVLVQGDSISKILNDQNDFHGDNVIEGIGMTLIPGLINSHTHAYNEDELEEAAKAGVLTVISLGHKFPIAADSLRILSKTSSSMAYFHSAGNTITVPNGHGTQFGRVPVVNNLDGIPEFVKDRIEEGSEFIKLIVDPGSRSRPLPTLSEEMVKSGIATAQQYNKLSIVHIWNRKDALMATKAKVDGLAHIWATDTSFISKEELAVFSEFKPFIIPTLVVITTSTSRKNNKDVLSNDVFRLYKSGVPILAGTDAARGRKVNFGTSIHDELKLFVESGFTPLDALKSATSIPSEQLELGERGRIKEGFSADFVLINGDPTETITDLIKIEGIWKTGNRITPYNKH